MEVQKKIKKIKKSTLIKSKENGGLNMVDFTLFDKALKISWVRRICSEGNQPFKFIPLNFLSGVGGTLVFRCNDDLQYFNLSAKLPTFYKDIISYWQELNKVVPTTKKDVLDQIVWNNNQQSLRVFSNWQHAINFPVSSMITTIDSVFQRILTKISGEK